MLLPGKVIVQMLREQGYSLELDLDGDGSRPLDPCTYAVHVDIESGESWLVEE
jgi:hypothetical protein